MAREDCILVDGVPLPDYIKAQVLECLGNQAPSSDVRSLVIKDVKDIKVTLNDGGTEIIDLEPAT